MTIRAKTGLILVLTHVVVMTGIMVSSTILLLHGAKRNEVRETSRKVTHALEVLNLEISHLDAMLQDYAGWDDTCAFIEDRNEAYIESNLVEATFLNNRFGFLLFLNEKNDLVYGKAYDLDTAKESPVPSGLLGAITQYPRLTVHRNAQDSVSGMLVIREGPILITSKPIVTSNFEGPVRGSLIGGRFLGRDEIQRLARLTNLSLHFDTFHDLASNPKTEALASAMVNDNERATATRGRKAISGYGLIRDITGRPTLVLRVDAVRELYTQALRDLLLLFFSLILVASAACAAALLGLNKVVLSRLARVSAFVQNIRSREDLQRRLDVHGNDAISSLSSSVNAMLETLQRYDDERCRAVQELSTSEQRFRNLLEAVDFIAVMLDTEGRITFCNEFLLRLTGWERDEVLGRSWVDLFIPEEERTEIRGILAATVAEGNLPPQHENPIVTKDGERRLILWDNTFMRESDGRITGIASFGRDMTDHYRLEEQYRQSQKLEGIGQLAGGVAHDFNNLLQVIGGYTDLAIKQMPSEEPARPELREVRAELQEVVKAADQATVLVRQLLTFSRREMRQLKNVDLNKSISDIAKMLRRVIGEHIELQTSMPPGLWPIHADPGHMEQILMNLCINSRDAMPRGGTIRIETANMDLDAAFIAEHPWAQPGRHVVLTVADSGCGMPPDVLEHIFEPFFTTKEIGRGTGLGLATVYGIVKQHDGFVHVYSDVGHGTVFRIYFPAIEAVVPDETPAVHSDTALTGQETILVAEDDASVRAFVIHVLESAGYHVIAVPDGQDAVEQFQAHTGEIDLVLLDVIMPKMSGRAVAEHIGAIRPSLPIIISTGHDFNILDAGLMPTDHRVLITKPYHPHALLSTIRLTLDGVPAGV